MGTTSLRDTGAIEESVKDILIYAGYTVEESVEVLPCWDASWFPEQTTAAFFLGLNNCTAIQHECWMMNMTAYRALCPFTCGCVESAPNAGGFFQTQFWGCPRACSVWRYTGLWWGSCQDDLESISNSNWKVYVNSLRDYVTSLPGYAQRIYTYTVALPQYLHLSQAQG